MVQARSAPTHCLCVVPTWRTGQQEFKALMKNEVPACSAVGLSACLTCDHHCDHHHHHHLYSNAAPPPPPLQPTRPPPTITTRLPPPPPNPPQPPKSVLTMITGCTHHKRTQSQALLTPSWVAVKMLVRPLDKVSYSAIIVSPNNSAACGCR
jgi:hypothetical protein